MVEGVDVKKGGRRIKVVGEYCEPAKNNTIDEREIDQREPHVEKIVPKFQSEEVPEPGGEVVSLLMSASLMNPIPFNYRGKTMINAKYKF